MNKTKNKQKNIEVIYNTTEKRISQREPKRWLHGSIKPFQFTP
jgi:hypothetical protein